MRAIPRTVAFLAAIAPAAALAQGAALPANQFMASPSGSTGFLSPRAMTLPDILAGASCSTGQVLYDNSGAVGCQAASGGGNVSNTGTPTSGQIAIWTNATTVQGVTILPVANGGTGVSTGPLTIGATISGTCPSGQILYSNSGVLGCEAAAGGGNVSNSGTPTSGQVAVWTNATTVQGVSPTGTGSPVFSASPTLTGLVTGTMSAPAWASFSTTQDSFRVSTGGLSAALEFGAGALAGVQTLVGTLDVPSTSLGGGMFSGVSGYARGASTVAYPVGVFGAGMVNVAGASAWGGNFIGTNCGKTNCTGNDGFNTATVYGVEIDVNMANLSAGATPNNNVRGLWITGVAPQQSSNPSFDAIQIGYAGAVSSVAWKNALTTNAGAANVAVNIGPLVTGNNQPSQPIYLNSTSSGGANLLSSIQSDALGNIILTPSSTSAAVKTGIIYATTAVQYGGFILYNASNPIVEFNGLTASNDGGTLSLWLAGVSKVQLSAALGLASYINNGDNFCIGATSCSQVLSVTGTLSATSTVTFSGLTTGTNADFLCLSSGGVVLVQTSACTISSRRFKEDIRDFAGEALDEIAALNVVSFRMKPREQVNPDANFLLPQIGLIAENVAEVDPRLAIYEQDDMTPKSYRQESILALAIKGMQELRAENDNLKLRIDRLENQR